VNADLPPISRTPRYATAPLASHSSGEWIAKRGVAPLPIVIDFDVLKDLLPRPCPRSVLAMMNGFPLQGTREALDIRVVPSGPAAQHASPSACYLELLLVGGDRTLPPSIGMVQEPRVRCAVLEPHL
jgi:hypothetical protein